MATQKSASVDFFTVYCIMSIYLRQIDRMKRKGTSCMKKRFLPLLLALLLLVGAFGGAARADDTVIVNLGTAEAGAAIDRLLVSTESGSAALSGGALPEGCRIETETREDGAYHYLRGLPMQAGNFEFSLSVTGPGEGDELLLIEELTCALSLRPSTPAVEISADQSCAEGENVSFAVRASVADAGVLSYQWYASDTRSDHGGSLLYGATAAELRLRPEAGTRYYYCVVTNTNNGMMAAAASPAAAVMVQAVRPVSLSLSAAPAKLEFNAGDGLDTTGLRLLLTYSDGRTETISTGFSAEPALLGAVGSQLVTVSYAGLSCSYTVQVREAPAELLDLQIVDLPTKLDYVVGDWLDTSGMTLRVDTNKGSYDVSTGYSCTPRRLEQEGRQSITVRYDSLSATFTVNVASAEKKVESIVVTRRPAKLSYKVGEGFDPLGMALTVQTNQGAEEVTEGFTWLPQQFSYAGRQNVTIFYDGKSCTLELIVDTPAAAQTPAESPAPEPSPEAVPTTAPRPDTQVERRSGRTAVTVIAVAALLGLAALLAYVYLAKRERILALLEKLRNRTGRN